MTDEKDSLETVYDRYLNTLDAEQRGALQIEMQKKVDEVNRFRRVQIEQAYEINVNLAIDGAIERFVAKNQRHPSQSEMISLCHNVRTAFGQSQ